MSFSLRRGHNRRKNLTKLLEPCCGADRYLDLVFHFSTPEVFEILHLYEYDGEQIPLVITGALFEVKGGTGSF
ncbi:MAG: hypothetical protein GWO20_00230 [Candidatus Korarchaeota archaeon]|nr:hypothetical protein [Candidatus Korarchaeota archaeon]NIW12424.1 hypothetical protein [Candidatus Thorarchaeota archaeon]